MGLLGYLDSLDKDNLARLAQKARYIFLPLSNGFGVVCSTVWTFDLNRRGRYERKELAFTFEANEFTVGFVSGFKVFQLKLNFDFCVGHILAQGVKGGLVRVLHAFHGSA